MGFAEPNVGQLAATIYSWAARSGLSMDEIRIEYSSHHAGRWPMYTALVIWSRKANVQR